MAKGRLLNKKISLNDKVNRLSCDTSRLLFTWLIAHLDQHGCYYGEAKTVKSLVFPLRSDVKISKIESFLKEFEELGLIIRYDIEGVKYLFFPKFTENQPNLRPEREAESDIPPYQNEAKNTTPTSKNDGLNQEILRSNDGVNPSTCRSNDGITPHEEEEKINITEIENNMSETGKRVKGSVVSDVSIKLAKKLKSLILRNNPKAKIRNEVDKWAAEIDKMQRLDNRTESEIEAVIDFSQNDQFWSINILSASKLREKYDRLYMQMKRDGDLKNGQIHGRMATKNESGSVQKPEAGSAGMRIIK